MKLKALKNRAPSLRLRMTLLVAAELVRVSLIYYLLGLLMPNHLSSPLF